MVELIGNVADQRGTETALKSYMVHTSCPVGMVVTPEQVRFYRNRYTDYSPQTIEMIGECPTGELLGTLPQGALERALIWVYRDFGMNAPERPDNWPDLKV